MKKLIFTIQSLLKSIYLQDFVAKRLVKKITSDVEYSHESGLDTLEPRERSTSIKALRQSIGFLLSMHETYQTITKILQLPSEDEQWVHLIYSRTKMTKFGEKTLEGATNRFKVLVEDLESMGDPWDGLSKTDRFIAICATCYAIESYEMSPSSLPFTLCLFQFRLLVPRIFKILGTSL